MNEKDLQNVNVRIDTNTVTAFKAKANESGVKIAWVLEYLIVEYLNGGDFASAVNQKATELSKAKERKERNDKGRERGKYSKVEKIKVGDKWYTSEELEKKLGEGKQ